MKIIVALGNPGKDYQNTRHNAGWIFVDALFGADGYRVDKKFKAEIKESGDYIIVKPMTFMNNSGFSAAAILNYYSLLPKKMGLFKTKDADLAQVLTVIHDELDLNFGDYKVSVNAGPGSHNGVKSIISYLKTKNFKRIRLGINNELKDRMGGEKFVLSHFSKEEISQLTNLVNNTDWGL